MTADLKALLRDLLGVLTDMQEEVSAETFRHCCKPYIARITAALEDKSGGWMPIESAPKDKQILVTGGTFSWGAGMFDSEVKCEHVAMVHWHDLHKHWAGDYSGNGEDRYIYRPTLWQSLPPLPKGE